ncbi:dienelactone hydrolase family protein [Thioclava sp. GXIMD4216]|uniref:dienelactone hydrolase family protein n=1 Tax=Thioclava sp. GXIMD4216 TaxID=3131929 RepID=UPI0030D54984
MTARDLAYSLAGTTMSGRFVCGDSPLPRPALLLVHGAHGLDRFMLDTAVRLADLGFAVLAVDLWGGRALPEGPQQIEARIGACLADRAAWMARLEAARQALAAQPEADAARIGMLGYCFGGSSALEFIRTGGAVRCVASIHAGLDLVANDWSAASAGRVLLCTGSDDPMAQSTDLQRLTAAMSAAAVPWEADIYGGARHAFTEPDAPGRPPFARYDAYADQRSWAAMADFFTHCLA